MHTNIHDIFSKICCDASTKDFSSLAYMISTQIFQFCKEVKTGIFAKVSYNEIEKFLNPLMNKEKYHKELGWTYRHTLF